MSHLFLSSVNGEGLNAGVPTLIPLSFPGQAPGWEQPTEEHYLLALQNALALLRRGWSFPAFSSHGAATDAAKHISAQGEQPRHNSPYGLIEALSNWRGGDKASSGGF